jgi:hypothetical protein
VLPNALTADTVIIRNFLQSFRVKKPAPQYRLLNRRQIGYGYEFSYQFSPVNGFVKHGRGYGCGYDHGRKVISSSLNH